MDFEAWLLTRQYASSTTRVYGIYARKLARTHDPATCTSDDLEDFFETIPRTAPSQRQARKALIAYFTYLKRDPNPAMKLPSPPEPHRLPRPLSEDEHVRWVAAAHVMGGQHELAGVLLASTGCRQGELRKARWQDISIEGATWRVKGKGARQRGPIWRSQPLHPTAVDVLRVAPRYGDWLFPGTPNHMSDSQMRAHLIEIGETAGLGRVTPHRLRHSVGTLALSRTGNLRAVQTLLGHRAITSTVQYTALMPEMVAALISELPV